ncbi:MAG TPA: hypothetical protein PLP27_08710 [Crocinitomicaceae bacterium]|nr:hypothetical protein [Crocinitomicaceae bacterium]
MLRLFSQINIASLLLFPGLICFYVFLHNTFHEGLYTFEIASEFSLGVWGLVEIGMQTSIVANSLLILLNAALLNWVFNKLNFHEQNSLLPGFIYVILLTNTREFSVFDGALIFHLLLIIALYVTAQITFNTQYLEPMFNLGFLIGVASTFFPFLYFAFPLFYLLTLSLKSYKTREMITYFGGWLIPQLFGLFFLYYYKLFTIEYLYDSLFLNHAIPLNYFIDVILLGIITVVILLAIRPSIVNISIHLKKFINILFVLTFISAVFAYYCYFAFDEIALFQSFIVPVSFLFAVILLKNPKAFIPLISFYSALIFSFLKFFFI